MPLISFQTFIDQPILKAYKVTKDTIFSSHLQKSLNQIRIGHTALIKLMPKLENNVPESSFDLHIVFCRSVCIM